MDAIVTLKAELDGLNLKCQSARDNEVRYALQRSRLEAERAQLLVKMMDAMVQQASVPSMPYRVVMETGRALPQLQIVKTSLAKQSKPPKPVGLPAVTDMIEATLKNADEGLRPVQITNNIRTQWWSDMPSERTHQGLFRLVKYGRVQRYGDRYRLTVMNGGSHHDVAKQASNAPGA